MLVRGRVPTLCCLAGHPHLCLRGDRRDLIVWWHMTSPRFLLALYMEKIPSGKRAQKSSRLCKSWVKYITAQGWGVSDRGNYYITQKAGIRAYAATDCNSLRRLNYSINDRVRGDGAGGWRKWSKAHLDFTVWQGWAWRCGPNQSSSPYRGSKLQSHKLNTIPITSLTL